MRSIWIFQVGLNAITDVLIREQEKDHTHTHTLTLTHSGVKWRRDVATSHLMLEKQGAESPQSL